MRSNSLLSWFFPVLVLTAGVPTCTLCFAQVEEVWAARYGSIVDGRDQANALAVDDLGNVYVTGNSNARQTTLKYSREGREVWRATYVPDSNFFDCPSGLAVDSKCDVSIRCLGAPYAIVKYSAE